MAEHESIHQQLLSLLELSPSELPTRHRHLLSPEHTNKLLRGSTRRERVILKVRTATKQVSSIIFTLHPPVVPREKGLKWKKRCKK